MTSPPDPPAGGFAATTIRRRIEWAWTDAAGIYHWSTVPLLVEAAETELLDGLGLADRVYGRMPRANVRIDFRAPLRFNEVVEVRLEIVRLGRSSIVYRFVVARDEEVAAEGELTVVHVDDAGRPAPLPDDLRGALHVRAR